MLLLMVDVKDRACACKNMASRFEHSKPSVTSSKAFEKDPKVAYT